MSSSYRQQYALKFPHETGASYETNQGTTFVSSADVARRLKMLFPDIDNFSEQFNQNLLTIVNSRIGKILNSGAVKPQLASNTDLYSIHRYSPSQQHSSNINTNYYAGSSSSSNYNQNYNTNDVNRQQQGDRSHIVYVTNSRGQVEYIKNERTGEKTRVL